MILSEIFFCFQALQQLQTINGFTGAVAAGTPVTSPALTLVNGTGQPSVAVSAAQATPVVSVAAQPTNPYQGASLTASTSPTAQPMNILALQQLLASTGQGSLLTNGAASGKILKNIYLNLWALIYYYFYCQDQRGLNI